MNKPKLEIIHGSVTTTSLDVAQFFDRKHKDVMNTIRSVSLHLSDDFIRRNFSPYYGKSSQGKEIEMYRLTKSGFAMIALGFTGEKAIKFREAYITRFDEMEAELNAKNLRRIEGEYVEEKYLPFDEPVIRASVPVGLAVKHLHILGHYLDWTPARLKGMLKRGELEGHQDERGHWRIYNDQITRLVTR